jgi:hypothetical protein
VHTNRSPEVTHKLANKDQVVYSFVALSTQAADGVLDDGFAVQIGFAIYLLLDEEPSEEADSGRSTVLPNEIGESIKAGSCPCHGFVDRD